MAGEANLDERHTFLKNLLPPEAFKDETRFNDIFDFMMKYIVKLYGSGKVRPSMKDNPGSGVINFLAASDFEYVVAAVKDKKEM